MELGNLIYKNFVEHQPYCFMKHRIQKILLVCCNYDEYILEEDGHIETQINKEYMELNMSNPPSLTHVHTTSQAIDLLKSGEHFDCVISMYNVSDDSDVFNFAEDVKAIDHILPVVLLSSFSKEIYKKIAEHS